MSTNRAAGLARATLAGIRIANGSVALFAPSMLARRLGVGPRETQPVQCAFRLFGMRTILIGVELLLPEGEVPTAAVRVAPVIHASDTLSAAVAGAAFRWAWGSPASALPQGCYGGLGEAVEAPRVPPLEARFLMARRQQGIYNATRREDHDENGDTMTTQRTYDDAVGSEQLLAMSEEELDNLFRRSPAGPIPNGEYDGTAIAAPGTEFADVAAKFAHLLAWKGKVFDARRGILENRVTPFDLHAVVATVYRGESWFDQKECIVLDYSKTSLIAHWIRDEIREVAEGVYLGLVFWDTTRILYFALRSRP